VELCHYLGVLAAPEVAEHVACEIGIIQLAPLASTKEIPQKIKIIV
jgi:hypothetical protein